MPEPCDHDHRGVRAIQRMVEFAPSTGGLALWVRHQNLGDGEFADCHDRRQYGVLRPRLRSPRPARTNRIGRARGSPHRAPPSAARARSAATARRCGHAAFQHLCRRHRQQHTFSPEMVAVAALICLPRPVAGDVLELDQDVETALLEWDVERLYRSIDDRRVRDDNNRQRVGRSGQTGGQSQEFPVGGPRFTAAGRRPAKTKRAETTDRSRRGCANSAEKSSPISCQVPTRTLRRNWKPNRRANGANASCAAMPVTATSRCCAP